MGKIAETANSEALHVELCTAIADLAKSVDFAVKRMALRAEFNAAIVDANKAELAAQSLQIAASSQQTNGIMSVRPVSEPVSEKAHTVGTNAAVEELYAACRWLVSAQAPRENSNVKEGRVESAIATRVLELHDRYSWTIK